MVELVEIEKLKCHEEINPEYLEEFKKKIVSDGVIKTPIVVDKNTNVILDGMHRIVALVQLGYKKIPVEYVDYKSPKIRVLAWREGETVTKEMVINAGLSGRLLPAKTSKHMIETSNGLVHVSQVAEEINVPLDKLR